ncbi:MAG: hypothetical protein IT204_22865 [Fimbriimonadaceae bacterium]|nr:hypothetical protein [Fimbriimonadaceae bacterium]
MDAKRTILIGAGLLLVGLIWAWAAKHAVLLVLAGLIGLLLLLAAVMMLFIGVVQVREDRALAAKEAADTAAREAMTVAE